MIESAFWDEEVRVKCHGDVETRMLTREQAVNGEHLKLEVF